jgi:hypothetical protein
MEFVVKVIDPCTECIKNEYRLEVSDAEQLAAALAMPDFDPNGTYELNEVDLDIISQRFSLPQVKGERWGRIRVRRWFDDFPYRLHTDRELALMLAGVKPLASFVGEYPPHPEIEEIPDRLFDPYVAEGRFIKREFVQLQRYGRALGLRRVLYSLASETWRIDAYILLLQVAEKAGWDEALERIEGSLLGYEEWQNDAYFLEKKRHFGPQK